MIKAGQFYQGQVLRKTDIGYMISINKEEVFLHQHQAIGDLKDGEKIDVFAYFDNKRRISLTMEEAKVTISNPGWVIVKEVILDLGVFVNINISKDILIATDYLPYDKTLWPIKGDKLFCILKAKVDRLNAKIVNNIEVLEYIDNPKQLHIGDKINAFVCRINDAGEGFFTEDLNYIFVHKTQMRKKYRLGEEVTLMISHLSENGYNGSLIENKEKMIDEDMEKIKKYLLECNKIMPYGNDTSSEIILSKFNMSKKAFKRALGGLYKDRIIDFDENGNTILIK